MPIVPVDLDDAAPGGFAARDRAIFAYGLAAGDDDWRGDPLAIEARYEAAVAALDLDALAKYLERRHPTLRLIAQRRLAPAIRGAFGLPAFAESRPGGLTVVDAFALLGRFFAFQDLVRARYRREAELLATYGPLPGRAHGYEREAGLWWNRERSRAHAAVAHWHGALAAGTFCELPFSLADAQAHNEAAARALARRINDDRRAAEAAARPDRPGAR